MTDFGQLLLLLSNGQVEFIVVGGVAAAAHGAARATQDLDIVCSRSDANLVRLVDALRDAMPYPRGAPAGLPFRWDASIVRNGLNFTLTTSLGQIDLLGTITGGGDYAALLPFTGEVSAFGATCRFLQLDKLIEVKRAAGRPKDFEAIAELELLWQDILP